MVEIVKANNVYFTYSQAHSPVLNNISFSVESNTFTTIIGENGSGKSTLAKTIVGLNKPDKGEIQIAGLQLNEENLDQIRANVGMVFQNPDNQFVGATVADDVAFGLENHQVPHNQMEEIVEKYLSLVKMWDYRDRTPETLSGGQKQRVAIASALAYSPKVLILDEASSMLDPKGRKDLLELILELKKTTQTTIISVTHNLSEALVSDRVYLLTKGQINGSGTPQEIFTNRKLIKDNNLELPFIPELIYQLKKQDFPLKKDWMTEEELIEFLWTLASKM
ncbi:energy-coupling factor transporter ATPase [Xylocopilactobacillus apis]|uniref:Energy-coupling factor transporter ATP-binding protein EcfA1 n=1 Tax=Xylocopilactobacillus apis TaxID=2932183 RepID=A0AAU9DNE3_9LACO|nr:energy-coupling factor transporter ATPase [Xylocopilactobacillus apis]BDR57244.1 energy-coupling factor transporter ATP-binding protein EcfA1 [Xylocopilactobacillus apis]